LLRKFKEKHTADATPLLKEGTENFKMRSKRRCAKEAAARACKAAREDAQDDHSINEDQ
jgi:hypothetical protein